MKFMAMLICAAAMTVFTSCTVDPEEGIVGRWECTHLDFGDGEALMQALVGENSESIYQDGIIWEFFIDGSLVRTSPNGEQDSTRYTISGDQLYMDNMDGLPCEIEKITNRKLRLTYTYLFKTTLDFKRI